MTFRTMLPLAGVLLILFLGMFTWNQRTRVLDNLAADIGLEVAGAVLSPLRSLQAVAEDVWKRYCDLVDVRMENERLRRQLQELEERVLSQDEDLAELRRLRDLVQMHVGVGWRRLGARVLAGRMGPNAVLDSITINRGYSTGGRPGTPLVTHLGLVGRVLKASPHTATALLLTDPSSRIAVFAQDSRASGILIGMGVGRPLVVDYVQRDTKISAGEVLVTSGLDNKYPKGIPVARVHSAAPSNYNQFMYITAEPLADLRHLEEVLLLEPTGAPRPAEPAAPPKEFVGPPAPGTAAP